MHPLEGAIVDAASLQVRIGIDGVQQVTGGLKTVDQAVETTASEGDKHLSLLGKSFSGLGSVMGTLGKAAAGVAVGGIAAAGAGFGAAALAGLSFNNSLEQATARLNAFTGDGAETAKILEMVRDRAAKTPFAFEEMASAAASLGPASRAAGLPLEDLIAQAEILAASNPAQGFEGAVMALREATGGDFTSIIERFDLPRQRLNELKAQGVPAIEAVQIAMKEMGLNADLVANMGNTMAGRWSTFKDTLTGLAATATGPLFEGLSSGLGDLQTKLDANMPALQGFATMIGEKLGAAFSWLIDTGIPALVGAWQSIQPALSTVGGVLSDIAERVFPLLQTAIGFVTEHWQAFAGAFAGVGALLAGPVVMGALTAIGGVLTALISPIGLVIAAAALLGAAWAENWGGIREKVGAVVDWLQGTVWPWFQSGFAWLQDTALPALQGAFATAWPIIQEAISGVVMWLQGTAWPFLQEAFAWVTDTGLPAVQTAFETVWPVVQGAVETVYAFLKDVAWPWFQTAFGLLTDTVLPSLQTAFTEVWPKIQAAVETVFDWLKDTMFPWLQNTAFPWLGDTALPALKVAFETAWSAISTAVRVAYTFLRDTVWPWLQNTAFPWLQNTALPALQSAFEKAWPMIKNAVNTAYVFLKDTVWPWLRDTAWPWLKDTALPAMQTAFETVWPKIQSAVNTTYTFLMDTVWPWLRDVAWPWLKDTALPAMQTAFETVWPLIKTAVNTVYAFLKDTVWPWLRDTAWPWLKDTALPAMQTAFETVWKAVKTAVETTYTFFHDTVWPWLDTAMTNIGTWITTAKDTWNTAWGAISGAVDTAKNTISGAIDTIKSLVDAAITKINALITLINKVPGIHIPTIPGVGGGGGYDKNSIARGLNWGAASVQSIGQLQARAYSPLTLPAPRMASMPSVTSAGRGGDTVVNNSYTYNVTGNYKNQNERRMVDDLKLLAMLTPSVSPTG